MPDLAQIKDATVSVYDRHAKEWDARRNTGKPFADAILARGHRLTGIDGCAEMICLAQHNYPPQIYPDACWKVMDMRRPAGMGAFDIILSWDGFFHLTPSEQQHTLPKLCEMLRPEGRLMLTVGDLKGEVTGQVFGEPVYHASLSRSGYRRLLNGAGLRLNYHETLVKDTHQRTVLFASKPSNTHEI
ncbi:hypothetical protein NBRC116601_04150 [Cognatishimia sp. WU-CL00825]|uniref:class I SAM-dependent methyltransferase n=1 Tax=Cognatishimia sp. WU-CL00825 TaxID=3127658 RepID=UPI003106A6D9